MSVNLARRFGGIARLYGEERLNQFAQSHVCVIGVGGVGSWTVETLVRSGVGAITMVDLDNVSESNCNRQLSALDPHFGKAKVAVITERMHAINPHCRIRAVEEFIHADNLAALLNEPFDYLVDAIDHTATKAAIAAWCIEQNYPFIVCGGAGGKIQPQYVKVDDLSAVQGDRLLANLRHTLRKHYGFSQPIKQPFSILCVYSDEPVRHPLHRTSNMALSGLSCSGYGSSMAVTATFGLIAAATVINILAGCTSHIIARQRA